MDSLTRRNFFKLVGITVPAVIMPQVPVMLIIQAPKSVEEVKKEPIVIHATKATISWNTPTDVSGVSSASCCFDLETYPTEDNYKDGSIIYFCGEKPNGKHEKT